MKKPLLIIHRAIVSSVTFALAFFLCLPTVQAQEDDWSMARTWNEEMLFAISVDLGRPTIHARNLYHTSLAMYEAWAAYDQSHDNKLLGKTLGTYVCPFDGAPIPSNPEELKAAREEALSFAMYRMMAHRFATSPGHSQIMPRINNLMETLGYDRFNTSMNYATGGPAELGNYIAEQIKFYGFIDGANEIGAYANQKYHPRNGIIYPQQQGNNELTDPNLWQPISVTGQISQDGSPLLSTPGFLSAEWGDLVPFAYTPDDIITHQRDGLDWKMYHDPGHPPYLDTTQATGWDDMFKWSFMMVSIWGAQLDPDEETMWDVSPASIGDIPYYPTTFEEFPEFYNMMEGGVYSSTGRDVNPKTGLPYEEQWVRRGDFVRVVAEFWADGPQSFTPPGHWYEIINHTILSHPDFERRWMGEGEIMDDLEYDVKLYFTIGGAMYDVAVSVWGMKGYYDYIRPVSAIRYLCQLGQSSDSTLANYHPGGTPLMDGYIEVVEEGDPLAGSNNENVGKIKLYTWKGPDHIDYADTVLLQHPADHAGVGWILGENWWPWQRPKFVTPPFAGYISGHSTFSSTAATVLETVTGDPFFPGGMGEFFAGQNEFLHFEVGPSTDIKLQWATYRDASDQCSLSRIWGGIHPPIDDLVGRHIGMEIGEDGVNYANNLFNGERPFVMEVVASDPVINIDDIGGTFSLHIYFNQDMDTNVDPTINFISQDPNISSLQYVSEEWVSSTEYVFNYNVLNGDEKLENVYVQVVGAFDTDGRNQHKYVSAPPMLIDTERPEITAINYNETLLNDAVAESSWLLMTIELDEKADTSSVPAISFDGAADLSNTLFFLPENSMWIDAMTYQATFSVVDNDEEVANIGVAIVEFMDRAGNEQTAYQGENQFSIDTRNPEFVEVGVNNDVLNVQAIGNNSLQVALEFDEAMDMDLTPSFNFVNDNPLGSALTLNTVSSGWADEFTYNMNFNLSSTPVDMSDIVIELSDFTDAAGNVPAETTIIDLFIIDTQKPLVADMTPSTVVISDNEVGTGSFEVLIQYEEAMNQTQKPVVVVSASEDVSGSIQYNIFSSEWNDDHTFAAVFNIVDENIEVDDLTFEVTFGQDVAMNFQDEHILANWIDLDTRNPQVLMMTANAYEIVPGHIGSEGFHLIALFDEQMDVMEHPSFIFDGPEGVNDVLTPNTLASVWLNNSTYKMVFDVANVEFVAEDISILLSGAYDVAGNEVSPVGFDEFFDINMQSVGIDDLAKRLGITFFPNPIKSGNVLKFEVTEPLMDAELRIVSANGQTIVQKRYQRLDAGMHDVELRNVLAGSYIIHITSKSGTQTQQLVVLE